MRGFGRQSMIDIGLARTIRSEPNEGFRMPRSMRRWATHLLTCADTPVDLVDQTTTNHFEKYDAGAGVEYLLVCRAVGPVLHVRIRAGSLSIDAHAHHIRNIDLS